MRITPTRLSRSPVDSSNACAEKLRGALKNWSRSPLPCDTLARAAYPSLARLRSQTMRTLLPVSFVLFVSFVVSNTLAQQVAFVPHDINPSAEYPACGVIDVNKDGKLDIV